MEAIRVKIYNASPLMYDLLKEIAKTREEHASLEFVEVRTAGEAGLKDAESAALVLVVLGESVSVAWKFVKELKSAEPKLPVLLLARNSSKELLRMALAHGVEGLATEQQGVEWIFHVLHKLAKGEKYFDADAIVEVAREDGSVLDHERQLLIMIGKEKERNEMALALKVSVRTVDLYLAALRKKLGVRSNVGLALYAKRVGLV